MFKTRNLFVGVYMAFDGRHRGAVVRLQPLKHADPGSIPVFTVVSRVLVGRVYPGLSP